MSIPTEVVTEIENEVVEVGWTHDDKLTNAQISSLLSGDKTLDDIWYEIADENFDYLSSLREMAVKNILSRHGIDYADLDVYPSIDPNMDQLVRNSRAFVGMNLTLEHYVPGMSDDLVYEDYSEELEFFGINPVSVSKYVNISGLPNIPDREAVVSTRDLAEAWVNCFYSGTWTVLLAYQRLGELFSGLESIIENGIILEAGTLLLVHDYLNGASSTEVTLLGDLHVPASRISEIYNDGDCGHGIQRCCGLIESAWDGNWRLK
jgi:hypothetical protein